jgi:hypothetical protein
MNQTISHDRYEETLEAKARWFQSLSLAERMDLLCFFADLILDNNSAANLIAAKRAAGREVDLEDVRLLELDDQREE